MSAPLPESAVHLLAADDAPAEQHGYQDLALPQRQPGERDRLIMRGDS